MGGLKGLTLKQMSLSVKLAPRDECCIRLSAIVWCSVVLMEMTGPLVGMRPVSIKWTIISFHSVLKPTAETHAQGLYFWANFKRRLAK